MQIETLEVEEGFLDGLSLAFAPGLNVLIGPRGSGKTSVIELLRFCFGVEPYTRRASVDAREHVLSILGPSGRATAIVNLNGERLRVSRAAEDEQPRIYIDERPIVLSQREIEAVGVDAAGRLALVDGFRSVGPEEADAPLSELKSLTAHLQDLATELATIQTQAVALESVTADLAAAEALETQVSQSVAAASGERERLSRIGDDLAALSVRAAVFERSQQAIEQWRTEIESLSRRGPRLEDWPEAAKSQEPLGQTRKHVADTRASLKALVADLKEAVTEIGQLREADQGKEVELADEARELRKQVEVAQAGAGDASRRVAQLRERAGQLSALTALQSQRQAEITDLQQTRTAILDTLDASREARFEQRKRVISRLKAELGPRIDLRITCGAQVAGYVSAITSSLRGSGLHYKNLAPRLAQRLAPRELIEAVEKGDAELIASLGEISTERATRLIDQIRTNGSGEILAAPIEDVVEFFLLDGKEYKPTEQLSTGQRCTVVLPILLAHDDRVLVVDEPEAHLDNAFVVGTVVHALRTRGVAQTICATHNANIPVLGDASRVIALRSDGEHGFVGCADPLDEPPIVEAISSVMEGGREAFELRAEFYGSTNPAD